MFERLSRSAKSIITVAATEAASRGEVEVDDTHLLLACATVDGTPASSVLTEMHATPGRIAEILDGLDDEGFDDDDARALRTVGIDLHEVLRSAEDVFGAGALDRVGPAARRGPRRDRPRLGPLAKQAIANALQDAIHHHDRRIEAEHILLAMLRRPSARLVPVLFMLDLDFDAVRAKLGSAPGAAAAS